MEANGRLQRSNDKCLWPECVVEAGARDFKLFERLEANGMLQRGTTNALTTEGYGGKRLERPNNRGLWRQTAG